MADRVARILRFCWPVAWLILALGGGNSALALDPNHKLTQYLHRTWQTQAGLAQASIYAVTQTKDGYLWVATQSGVARFDGVEFQPVRALQANALGEVWARAMTEDAAGRLWITTSDLQMIRVDGGNVKVFTEQDGLPANDYSCLVRGTEGDMWACTAAGLVRIQGDKFELHESPTQIVNRPLSGCRASDGKIWIAGTDVLASWDGSRFTRVLLKSVSGNQEIRTVACTPEGVWVGSGKGLIRYHQGEEKLYTVKDGLADDVILSLAPGQNGALWVGTRNGFSRVRNGSIDSYGYRDGLSQNAVNGIFEDREGGLWVATKNGLNQFIDGIGTRYDKGEGLPSDNMGPVFQDKRGNLWAGSLDGGLSRLTGGSFSTVAGFPKGSVTSLAEDATGSLWAGTTQGAVRLEDGDVKQIYTTAQGLPSNRIHSLFRDHGGNLWAGTEKGPAVFQGGRFTQIPLLDKELSAPIASIGETRDGVSMLFAVARGSVYLYTAGSLQKLESPPSNPLPFRDIDAIYTDQDGTVWMGTNGFGLGMWRNGKLTRFLVRDGLYDSEIYGFVSETPDRLWMACSKGFYWVNRKDLMKFARGEVPKIVSSPYSPLDGLRTTQGTPGVQPVAVRSKDGRLWFSATAWLLAVAPDLVLRGSAAPVVIGDVTINGNMVDPASVTTLGPGRTNVEFQYTALTYLAPQRLNFRYMLEGYDRGWIDAGSRREAFYTNLPPGKFRFRVEACGPFIRCNETAGLLSFEVAPQFYQRTWFIPVCLIAAGLLVWLIYRLRVRQLRDQFVLILAERSRIARELHDTLIQGFSGITMQLHAFTNRITGVDDRQALGEIIRDAGICLQETRRSVAGLRAGTGSSTGLAAAISDAAHQLTQERDIRLKLNLNDGHVELPAEVKYNLLCIVQEAITNSIKHSGARTIEVNLACSANDLRLSVRDDGRGMNHGDGNGRAGHYGMIGMKERASQIGAEIDLASAPGQGTKVSVRVPVAPRGPLMPPQGRLEPIR